MVTKYMADHDVIGATITESSDGGLLMMYSSNDGKHFFKSFDRFHTVAESWIVPIDSITANANLLRLKDGRLMTIVRRISQTPEIAKINGASFYTYFSDDDGHTFYEGDRINQQDACYYLMNNRILRTDSGRILLPVCYVPHELANSRYFEKTGCSGCFYSDDDGKTFYEGKWLTAETVDQLAEPMVAKGDDGALHMYMRTGHGYLYHSVSYDDGYSWEREEASVLRSPCAPFCLNFDPYSKNYFVVWDNNFPAPQQQYPRSPICIAKSCDCVHWQMICELDQDPMRSYGYPSLYFTEDDILITYYESPDRIFDRDKHRLKLQIVPRDEWI